MMSRWLMTRSVEEVVDDAMISPGGGGVDVGLKYAPRGGRGVSRDERRCERSFVGEHE